MQRPPGNLSRALFGDRRTGALDLGRFKCAIAAGGGGGELGRGSLLRVVCPCFSLLTPPTTTTNNNTTTTTTTTTHHLNTKKRAFLAQLNADVTRLEFAHYDANGDGKIRGVDFARSVAAAADIRSVDKYLDKVLLLDACVCVWEGGGGAEGAWCRRRGAELLATAQMWSTRNKCPALENDAPTNAPARKTENNRNKKNKVDAMDTRLKDAPVTFADFAALAAVRRRLHRLAFALEFCGRVGRPVRRADLAALTQRLAGVKLPPVVLDVLFALCGTGTGSGSGAGAGSSSPAAEERVDPHELVRLLRNHDRTPGRKVRSFCFCWVFVFGFDVCAARVVGPAPWALWRFVRSPSKNPSKHPPLLHPHFLPLFYSNSPSTFPPSSRPRGR
jgi:hypothetical protein